MNADRKRRVGILEQEYHDSELAYLTHGQVTEMVQIVEVALEEFPEAKRRLAQGLKEYEAAHRAYQADLSG